MTMIANRWAGGRRYGVGFASVSAVAAIVAPFGDLPRHDSSAASVAGWYAEHTSRIRGAGLLVCVAMLLLVVWAAAVATQTRGAGSRDAAGMLFAVTAGGFAVTFGAGAAAVPVAASLHAAAAAATGAGTVSAAATGAATSTRALHDAAVSLVAVSGGFGAGMVLAGAVLAGHARRRTWTLVLLALSAVAALGELAAPLGLLTPTGPLNPYDGSVTLVAGVVFLVWAAAFAAAGPHAVSPRSWSMQADTREPARRAARL